MRLWHKDIVKNGLLPDSQLVAQWRELNAIYGKGINHILINYVKEYPKSHLKSFSDLVIAEMKKRGYKVNTEKYELYFHGESPVPYEQIFENHQNFEYLTICFYNLEEKYIRGQKDFATERFQKLKKFYKEQLK